MTVFARVRMPSLGGATGWLNSEPLRPAELRGHVSYPNLVHFSQHDRGGHFAAWEQPQLLSEDVLATFRSLR